MTEDLEEICWHKLIFNKQVEDEKKQGVDTNKSCSGYFNMGCDKCDGHDNHTCYVDPKNLK